MLKFIIMPNFRPPPIAPPTGDSHSLAHAFLSKPAAVIIRARGLPYDCSARQVVEFFANYSSGSENVQVGEEVEEKVEEEEERNNNQVKEEEDHSGDNHEDELLAVVEQKVGFLLFFHG